MKIVTLNQSSSSAAMLAEKIVRLECPQHRFEGPFCPVSILDPDHIFSCRRPHVALEAFVDNPPHLCIIWLSESAKEWIEPLKTTLEQESALNHMYKLWLLWDIGMPHLPKDFGYASEGYHRILYLRDFADNPMAVLKSEIEKIASLCEAQPAPLSA